MSDRLLLWPSIDLASGKVVRLLRGEASAQTTYTEAPVEVAKRFEAEGADGLHVVDLDGAFARGENRGTIVQILRALRIPVQVGGGLRARDSIRAALDAGTHRVVLGSLPFTDPALFGELLAELGRRIVVALDCKAGRPTIRGWTQDAAAGDADAVARDLAARGVTSLLVTDVAKDGAMEGPGLDLLRLVRSSFEGEVIASGGMRGEEDLGPVDEALAGGPRGAIFGRALHDGRTTVARLVAARERRHA